MEGSAGEERQDREDSDDGGEKRQGGVTTGSPCSQRQRLHGRIGVI